MLHYTRQKEMDIMANYWKGFNAGKWQDEIDVRDFIQTNYTLYDGDDSFLEGITII